MREPVVQGPFIAWEDAIPSAELDAIEQYGDRLLLQKAEIAGKPDDISAVRITRLAWIERNDETAKFYDRLAQIVLQLNTRFYHFALTGLENLQYTIYDGKEGGHYDWHIDFGRHNHLPRKLSLSVQLSDSAQYEGCDLNFQIDSKIEVAPRKRGTVIAFPSFFMHRVTPILSGTRKSLVLWATGPAFR